MPDIWSDTARAVSDEWIAAGTMFVSPNGYYDNYPAESELAFWDEIERRVKLAEADVTTERDQPSGPQP